MELVSVIFFVPSFSVGYAYRAVYNSFFFVDYRLKDD